MVLKVSIITVVYNAGNVFEWTLKSIKNQKYNGIEYIVIDGGSGDNTLDLADRYKDVISKIISEPDNGLYYAMNKGLKMATGDYVMFLNAGDMLYHDKVLDTVFSLATTEADIYYGETMVINNQGKDIGMRRLKTPEKLVWKDMKNGMVVCHQAVIVKRSIVPFYNTEYRIASDYLWVLQCLKRAKVIVNTDMIISRFLDGGMNKSNIIRALWERFSIMAREFGFIPTLFQHIIIAGRFLIYFIKHRRF